MTETAWLPTGLFELGDLLGGEISNRLGRFPEPAGSARAWIDMARLMPFAQNNPDNPDRPDNTVMWSPTGGVVGGQHSEQSSALCVDLGPEDGPTWQRFAQTVANEPDVEVVASAAQEWHLAVTPYRHLSGVACPVSSSPVSSDAVLASSAVGAEVASTIIAGAVVIDLTSMWAGPLCTQLLAKAGAQVTKITCAKRPDGLSESPMYQPLNSAKQTVELDLDLPADRRQFDQLLSTADLLVTSLSPRALANFGLVPSKLSCYAPKLRMLAITAFAQNTPESNWIAYGTGVHAASGLGNSASAGTYTRPQVPAYSYPDPLAGLLACSVAIDLLITDPPTTTESTMQSTRQSTMQSTVQYRRVSLAEAIQPLVSLAKENLSKTSPAQ